MWVDLKAEENPLKMELDTGSADSIIPYELYRKKFNDKPLYKTKLVLLTYTVGNIIPVGVLMAIVKYKDQPPKLTVGSVCG